MFRPWRKRPYSRTYALSIMAKAMAKNVAIEAKACYHCVCV